MFAKDPSWAILEELEQMRREGPIVGTDAPPLPERKHSYGYQMPQMLVDDMGADDDGDAPLRAEDALFQTVDGRKCMLAIQYRTKPKKAMCVSGIIFFRAFIRWDGTWVYLESPCKEGL